jgi:BirA family biotin operon repressor/biotin-[acetyl-CoA-carboxylase] ligase
MAVALASGARLEIFDSLDSTSLEAKRRAATGEAGPLWLLALRQTAGYGRRGAPWMQQEGDVAATFLFRETAPSESLPQLSFVAALAVGDAIRRYAPQADISLKWPNDVLAGRGKIAGILLELLGAPSTIALGVGVNVVSSPQGLDYPAARLIDFAASPPHPRAFVETLDGTLTSWREIWRRQGFAPVRAEWLSRAEGLGRAIRVQLAGEIVEGVFKDLDLDGALILDCDGARRTIAAGAVLAPRETGMSGTC